MGRGVPLTLLLGWRLVIRGNSEGGTPTPVVVEAPHELLHKPPVLLEALVGGTYQHVHVPAVRLSSPEGPAALHLGRREPEDTHLLPYGAENRPRFRSRNPLLQVLDVLKTDRLRLTKEIRVLRCVGPAFRDAFDAEAEPPRRGRGTDPVDLGQLREGARPGVR